MRRIRDTLRLKLRAGLSYNEVGRALKISKSVAGKYLLLALVAGKARQAVGIGEGAVVKPRTPRGATHGLVLLTGGLSTEGAVLCAVLC